MNNKNEEVVKLILDDIKNLKTSYELQKEYLYNELIKASKTLSYLERYQIFQKNSSSLEEFNLLMMKAKEECKNNDFLNNL